LQDVSQTENRLDLESSLRAQRGNPCFGTQAWIATACGLAMTK
jgi:hypothetical protein